MSINVTVSGNPVSIKRGKLISTDPDYAKKEFDKRRRMRLEQVRHQSKEIAENVRNKVRKEKKKQLSDFEKEEEEKLKKWQNRKLLELQEQYCESLKDIGLGHAQAAVESTRDDIEEEYREKLKQKTQERGESAIQRLHAEKNKQSLKKAIPLQHRKLARDIENARSTMVSKSKMTPSKKRKKKAKANINVTTNVSSDSESKLDTEDIEELNILSDDFDSSLSETQESGARRKRTKSSSPTSTIYEESRVASPMETADSKKAKNIQKAHSTKATQVKPDLPKRSKSPLETVPEFEFITHYPMDTRISDRIRSRRYLLNPPEISESHHKETEENKFVLASKPQISVDSRKHIDKTSSTLHTQHTSEVPRCICGCTCNKQVKKEIERKFCSCCAEVQEKNELPLKPTVSLKSVVKTAKDSEKNDGKVQYYDHRNRYSKEYIASKSNVQRIPEESLEICPSTSSEKEFIERIYKHDRDAQIRGQKAMEKVNIHKDYKEMMKQLPVLQKQERIASISSDNPTFHMSNERLKQYERRKENRLENAYESYFPKTITIPPKKHVMEDKPYRTIDVSETTPSLNVAQWDVDKEGVYDFTLTKDSGKIVIETDMSCSNKEDYLKYLLERLKAQKEMLLREVASLPKNSNLNNIISDLEDMRNAVNRDEVGQKISSDDYNTASVPDTATKIEESKKIGTKATKHKRIRQPVLSTSNSSTNSTPPKKLKHKKYKIILQNTSTQTSPKPIMDKHDNKENTQEDVSKEELAKPLKKKSPKKGSAKSVSSVRSDKSVKNKVSRPTSPITISHGKDQASSPIKTDVLQEEEEMKSKSKNQTIKCKCDITKDRPKVCKCHSYVSGEQSDLCEILIKIKDNDEPEIEIKSPKKHKKSVIVKDLTKRSDEKEKIIEEISKQKGKMVAKRFVKIDDKPKEKPKTSWREQLSKNDIGASTSTSYYSPPEFPKSDFSRGPQAESTGNRSSHLSTDKSSQIKKKIDPRLLTYIKKLLSMSRTSIEELGVSTVSDVSTPSVSTFDSSSKNSLNQLKTIIKYFNLNPEELAYYLNYSDESEKTSGSIIDAHYSTPSTVHSSGYEASKSFGNNVSSEKSSSASSHEKTHPTPPSQYTQLAELCQKRISNLTAMIDKVRMEKQQILTPVHSDKENSTQYLTLPSYLGEKSPNTIQDNSNHSDSEQAEINRKLLEIDYALAEKLKTMTPQEIMERNQLEVIDDLDKDLLERYRRLISSPGVTSTKGNIEKSVEFDDGNLKAKQNIISETAAILKSPDAISFVPVLLDIPRLPKLIPNQENIEPPNHSDISNDRHKRPPPAKGLMFAKKYNEDITNVPHELSTIVEVDSQLSTKIRASISPKPSPTKAFEKLSPIIVLPEFPTDWHKEDEKRISEGSMPDIVAEISTNIEQIQRKDENVRVAEDIALESDVKAVADNKAKTRKDIHTYTVSGALPEHSTDSSTDKSDMETIEMMLQSMGMGWAVSTLRKTQAALTRASSSSSLEAASKHQLSNNSGLSDVTLRDILGKKIFSNSTSSSLSQSISPNMTKALNELSAIHGSGVSSENKQQRTSTPVQTTKSSESKKGGIFTAESEVSSVKLSEDIFITMRDTTGKSTD